MSLRRSRMHGHHAQPQTKKMSDIDWNVCALSAQLQSLAPDLTVHIVSQAASTNTALLEQAKAQRCHQPRLLVAERQTHGKGRLGRRWVTDDAHSALTFSLAWPMQSFNLDGLSLAVGLSIATALEPNFEPGYPRIGLKWPNDLWLMSAAMACHVGGKKLGGILIETCNVNEHRLAVVGVGLNIRTQTQLSTEHAHLQGYQAHLDTVQVLHTVASPLVQTLQAFSRTGFAPLVAQYGARDALKGRTITTPMAGVVHGVGSTGALQIQTDQGLREVVHGDIVSPIQPTPILCSD
jgi:BirA family transcriptional regulator, biotin operon repressor / biotin---[acetyl-CoA-carboxylase] ligase